jgi:phosphopantetheinyl transferase (holo-ACP synthase)
MIGNDLVDLNVASAESNWKRSRFLDKVFTIEEQQLITNSKNQHQTVWLLWSMKEAAYKVYVQQFGKRFFNPKRLVCHFDSDTSGFVTIESETYYTTSTITKNFIYTVTTLNNAKSYKSTCFKVEDKSYTIQSEHLKNHFLKTISKSNNYEFNALRIKKNMSGIPEVFLNHYKLPVSFSFTHHGYYCGYAIFK